MESEAIRSFGGCLPIQISIGETETDDCRGEASQIQGGKSVCGKTNMLHLIQNAYHYAKAKRDGSKSVTIVLIGLDNAGKTTIFNGLKGGE